MAKYAISQEGLDSLDKLSGELMQVVTGIDDDNIVSAINVGSKGRLMFAS